MRSKWSSSRGCKCAFGISAILVSHFVSHLRKERGEGIVLYGFLSFLADGCGIGVIYHCVSSVYVRARDECSVMRVQLPGMPFLIPRISVTCHRPCAILTAR